MKRLLYICLVAVLLTACRTAPAPASAPVETAPVEAAPAPVVETLPTAPTPATLPFQPAPDAIEKVRLAPGAQLSGNGTFFIDLATGAIEAWRLTSPDWGMLTPITGAERWLTGTGLLADRKTGRVWRYDWGQADVLAAAEEHLLLRRRGQNHLILTDADLRELASFPTDMGPQGTFGGGVFSPDGKRLLIRDAERNLTLVDVATGKQTALGKPGRDRAGFTTQLPMLVPDAGGVWVVTAHAVESQGEWRPETTSDVQRFDWNGKEVQPMISIAGSYPWFSPDGRWLAYDSILAGTTTTTVLADAKTGQVKQKVLSASLCYSDIGVRGGRWLSDSSGVVLRHFDGKQRAYAVLSTSGALKGAPVLTREPLPAPDSPGILALRDRSVVDLSGKVLLKAPSIAGNELTGDSNTWGRTSRELIVTLPHGGHGGRCPIEPLLAPRVEPGPIKPLVMQVNTPGDCLNLRSEPGGKEIKCLSHGTRLTVTAGKHAQPPLWGDYPMIADAYWAHVKAPTGEEGWVALKYDLLKWQE
ncbi:MAG TPA: hypothetical protein VNT75_08450 [Symbiobacteriaceae bacterium]|nr:hypothetical protein [Symbiobacteriaceae bacterium]